MSSLYFNFNVVAAYYRISSIDTFSGVHISESLVIPLFSEGNLDTVLLPKIFNKYTNICTRMPHYKIYNIFTNTGFWRRNMNKLKHFALTCIKV